MSDRFRLMAGRTRLRQLALFVQRRLTVLIVALVTIMGACTFTAFIVNRNDEAAVKNYIYVTRDVRMVQMALLEAQAGARSVVLSGDPSYLPTYAHALGQLTQTSPSLYALIDTHAARDPAAQGNPKPVSSAVVTLRNVWDDAVSLGLAHRQDDADALLASRHADSIMATTSELIAGYLADRSAKAEGDWQRIAVEQSVTLIVNLLGALIAIGATTYAFARSAREAKGRDEAILTSQRARREVETLFGMTDILQSAQAAEDANAVLRATATELMPDCGGVLYVFNNSRDRLDLAIEWGESGAGPTPIHITPDSCWALKRGKPHLNETRPAALRCNHVTDARPVFEIPIVARGEIHGLLALRGVAFGDAEALARIKPVAIALADAMSLALSNIALRERLRNQALRDPLTSLYNRRFLEEMMERLTTDAERRRAPLSVIMMDLDHFKKLNDRYGHAAGDIVLRSTATAVLSCLRPSDVACRYGGEELAILLPDCTLEHAIAKAEQIRARLATTSANDVPVTASFGVASMPETCRRAAELLPTADGALYQAKDQGRDRVVAAAVLPAAEMIALANGGRSASAGE
ncbi:MAG TPA: diguanylate cyclase [Acidisoma sp.]|uniref:sensor domain-containing diguanylate cyclase n=1 Tax=Acidisoma sp. TaxID=1872115 RepID=UPI002CA96B7A|nr:diguanylate cyclase [Acidisoma sp.]HTI03175.1 diguanylate cyclase [Acidisoma sp.]